jgi:tRNA wybutosine-synthesizing protein 3
LLPDRAKILHIQTASSEDANRVLKAAFEAGFRESGAMSLSGTPMVAVRAVGLAFDTIIGYGEESSEPLSIVDESYLQLLLAVANDRFKTNSERIDRFRTALIQSASSPKTEWEDPIARKERKRREGLLLRDRLRAESENENRKPEDDEVLHDVAV